MATHSEDPHDESHLLQEYPVGLNIEPHDNLSTEFEGRASITSLQSAASLPGTSGEPDSSESHLPSSIGRKHPVTYDTSADQHTLGLPGPTHPQVTLTKPKPWKTSNLFRILLLGLARCIASWVLIAGFYVSLWLYKDRIISPKAKSMFDTITIALSIAFGLNIASSLKENALDLRWWILSRKRRPAQEVRALFHP